ncbi:hypothetical protein BC830DRAFT_590900 [Chytriomyces sp. MP71]|nr:hypothetical protein BC830DRAFT_590900 [Chytriomyces sp. MP71]
MITPNEFMESIYMLGSTGDKPYNYMSGGVVEDHPFVIPPELLEDQHIQRHASASSVTSSAGMARSTPDLNSSRYKDLPPPPPSISTPDVRDVDRLAASESMRTLSARPSFTAPSYGGYEAPSSNDAVKDYGRPVSLQDGVALAATERERLRARSPRPTSVGETSYEFLSGRTSTTPQVSASRDSTPVIASSEQPTVPFTTAPNYAKPSPRPYAQEPLAPPPVLQARTSSQGLNLQAHMSASNPAQPQQPTPYRPNSAIPPEQGYGSTGVAPPRSPAPSTGSFDNASTRSGGGGGAPHLSVNELLQYSSQNLSFDKQVEEVMAMAPQYPRHVIEADLVYTGIVEITIERIVTGILPIQGMTYPKRQSTALAAHNASLRQDSASSSGSTAAFGSSQQDSYRGQSNSHPTYTQQSQYTQQQPSFSQPPQQHQQQYAAPPYNQQGYGQLHQSQPQYAHHALQQQQQQGYYGQQQQQQASAPHQPQPQYASIQQQYRPGNSAPSYPSYPTQSPQLAPGALYGQVPGRASTPSSSSSYDARAGSQRAGSGFSVLGPSQGGGGVGRMALEEQGRIGSGAVGVYSPGAGSGRPSMGGAPVPAPAPVGTVLDPFPGWEGGWPLALTSQLQKYSKAKREYEKTLGR